MARTRSRCEAHLCVVCGGELITMTVNELPRCASCRNAIRSSTWSVTNYDYPQAQCGESLQNMRCRRFAGHGGTHQFNGNSFWPVVGKQIWHHGCAPVDADTEPGP